ncbi:hypothetical protein ACLI4U_08935 [Natrialbaceae archaeon A-CW2]
MGGEFNEEDPRTILGTCSKCNTTIPTLQLLVKYQAANGWLRLLAKCPHCDEIVSPK